MTIHLQSVLCCIKKGTNSIKCNFDNNFYQPGDTAKLIAEIDNQKCKQDVVRVETTLYRIIRLLSDDGKDKSVKQQLIKKSYAGVDRGLTSVGKSKKILPFELTQKF